MSLPEEIQTFTVTFGPGSSLVLGTPLGMRVDFTPSTSAVWAATGTPLINLVEGAIAGHGMLGSVELPNPDQDGFIDGNGNTVRNWTYRAAVQYMNSGRTVAAASKVFTATADTVSPVHLDTLIPVASSPGVTVSIPDSWSAGVAAAQASAAAAVAGAASAEPAGLSDQTKTDLSTTFVAFRNADGTPAPSLRTVITLDAFGEPDDIITEEV